MSNSLYERVSVYWGKGELIEAKKILEQEIRDNGNEAESAYDYLQSLYAHSKYLSFFADDRCEGILRCFRALIEKYKNWSAMINLGLILCGYSENEFIQLVPDLKSHYNPHEGFYLIEEGVRLGENKGGPLGYRTYTQVANAFQDHTYSDIKIEDLHFKGEDLFVATAKMMAYRVKAYNALVEGRGVSEAVQEQIGEAKKIDEDMVKSHLKKLLGLVQMRLNAGGVPK